MHTPTPRSKSKSKTAVSISSSLHAGTSRSELCKSLQVSAIPRVRNNSLKVGHSLLRVQLDPRDIGLTQRSSQMLHFNVHNPLVPKCHHWKTKDLTGGLASDDSSRFLCSWERKGLPFNLILQARLPEPLLCPQTCEHVHTCTYTLLLRCLICLLPTIQN